MGTISVIVTNCPPPPQDKKNTNATQGLHFYHIWCKGCSVFSLSPLCLTDMQIPYEFPSTGWKAGQQEGGIKRKY